MLHRLCYIAYVGQWHVAFFIMEDERDQKNFGVIMEIMVVNIDQHYFHNVHFRFAQTHIMKIMLINIDDTIPHKCLEI